MNRVTGFRDICRFYFSGKNQLYIRTAIYIANTDGTIIWDSGGKETEVEAPTKRLWTLNRIYTYDATVDQLHEVIDY